MVVGDSRREPGEVRLEDRLRVRVLVLGVGDEQVDDAADVAGEIGTPDPVRGVEMAGGTGHREELGADALVDVLVEVERDHLECPRTTLRVGLGHGHFGFLPLGGGPFVAADRLWFHRGGSGRALLPKGRVAER